MLLLALTALAFAPPPLTDAQEKRRTPFVDVVRSEGDSVVAIAATHVVTQSVTLFDVFEGLRPRESSRQTIGSGSIIHPSGYVLTNAHVVAMASELSVILPGGKELTAHVVSALPEEDIAVIKCDVPRGTTLQAVRLGSSDDVMVGESVLAIGAPVGLQHTVTSGIVSALDREIQPSARVRFKGLIQIDAAINPGNSGGPLFNIAGEQIGVNTAIRGDAQNVGFAIAVDKVKAALPRVLAVEARGRERLGLGLTKDVVDGARRGVLVGTVERGSPAAAAGIEPGMIVVEIEGVATPTLVDALVALIEQPPQAKFTLRAVLPEGTTDTFKLAIEALPPPDGKQLAKARLGLELAELDSAAAARLGLRAGAGVIVKSVVGGSAAARAGIAGGDLVTRVGPFGVRKIADLGVLEKVDPGDGVPVRVVRIGKGRVVQTEVVLEAK